MIIETNSLMLCMQMHDIFSIKNTLSKMQRQDHRNTDHSREMEAILHTMPTQVFSWRASIKMNKVLIGCEFSGIVREAFNKMPNTEAWSCDLLETEIPGNHIRKDILKVINEHWDLAIIFPPCDHLCVSGARWFREKQADGRQQKAISFVKTLMNAPINHIAIENPIGILSTHIRKPDQIIQPWQFGHGETKATCLWLKNLPKLVPTKIVKGRSPKIHFMSPGPNRSMNRSRTYPGIANAMAIQWHKLQK